MKRHFLIVSSFIAFALLVGLSSVGLARTAKWEKKPAANFVLPTPDRVGAFLHPVIFANSEVDVLQTRRSNLQVKQQLVVRWGVHVFEVGEALYTCKTNVDCEFDEFIRLATYEKCEVKDESVACTGLLSGEAGGAIEDNSPHIHDTFNVEPGRRGSSDYDGPAYSPDSSPNPSEESIP